MNYKYVVLDAQGQVNDSFDSFEEAFKYVTNIFFDDNVEIPSFEELLDEGVMFFTIMKVQRLPFKILREVKITIHDEIRRKEGESHADTENHSCDNLFKEW